MKEIGDYVFQLPVEQRLVGTQDEIQAVCEHHRQLLLCLDGYLSGLRTKRYHLHLKPLLHWYAYNYNLEFHYIILLCNSRFRHIFLCVQICPRYVRKLNA
jgi:hypothetical protein